CRTAIRRARNIFRDVGGDTELRFGGAVVGAGLWGCGVSPRRETAVILPATFRDSASTSRSTAVRPEPIMMIGSLPFNPRKGSSTQGLLTYFPLDRIESGTLSRSCGPGLPTARTTASAENRAPSLVTMVVRPLASLIRSTTSAWMVVNLESGWLIAP